MFKVLDVERLQEIAGFNKADLNFDGASAEAASYFDQIEA